MKEEALRRGMLLYFNRVLLERHILTEREYRAMLQKLEQ